MSIETTVINIAFFVVCVALYKPLQRTVKFALISYLDSIKSNVESVLESKEEYDQLLRKIIKKNDNLDKEVDSIINQAKVTALQMEENAKKDIKELIEKKLEYTKKRIEEENILLMHNIRQNCINIATHTMKKVIEDNYSNNEDQKKILVHSYNSMEKILQ
jgi:F0F1-type ATP synthase membrane subunit b/b'